MKSLLNSLRSASKPWVSSLLQSQQKQYSQRFFFSSTKELNDEAKIYMKPFLDDLEEYLRPNPQRLGSVLEYIDQTHPMIRGEFVNRVATILADDTNLQEILSGLRRNRNSRNENAITDVESQLKDILIEKMIAFQRI